MATDWKALEEAEDHAYFMAELMDISPESFTLEEKKQIDLYSFLGHADPREGL